MMRIFEYAHESGLKALKAANDANSKRLQMQTNVLTGVAEGMFIVHVNLLSWTTMLYVSNGLQRKKTCFRGFVNNTGADQPAHPRRLISAFVIRFFKSVIRNLATGAFSIF